ncbi:sodium:calcium antiporter [Halomicrobium katesii]|uniref:sodium:calcium antiporter n=1 Tax=Halomicrobium katesii TaxID=437163 RepID=UPI00037748D6|nr:sodium:calcium antiporter [Halomicrobium katesii]
MSGATPIDIGIILAATVAIWKGSGWLEAASDELATYYGLPLVVQGAVIAAIGSSFPELASVVAAALQGSLSLGVGAIVGSAIFNILVIPAVSAIAKDGEMESSRALVYKEAQFYMLAVSVLVITFAMAVIYYPVDGETLMGTVTRPLALIPIAMYGLYVFIQFQDTSDYEADPEAGDGIDIRRQWGYLLAGLLVILVAVHYLVHSVGVIGTALGIPEFIMGVTIIAGATSLPDSLVSVRSARDDKAVASLGNVLGSNTFDLLVAIPVGVLIVGEAVIDFEMAVPMFGVLTLATLLLFTALRTDMVMTTGEAYALLAAYLAFVVWVVLETAGVIVGIIPN